MDDELREISEEIYRNVIAQLTLHLRFMDIALDQYVFVGDALEYRCDGMYFHYPPIAVIKTFKNNPKKLTRGYFHVVLHSVFQHAFFAENRKITLWDLACDIAVENVIQEIGLECMHTGDSEEKQKEIDKIKAKLQVMSAQNIYHYLEDELVSDQIKLLTGLFRYDDHSCWYTIRNVTGSRETLFGDEVKDDAANAGSNRFDQASHDTGEKKEGEDPGATDAEIQMIQNKLKDWKEISEKIETDLETFSKEHGDKLDALVQSLQALHREKYDYSTFLKKFMRIGEKMVINDDEFDYIFYTYGLQRYRNMPLIEPLEFKEMRNVRELVIAIDTSGSVQGDVVQGFLQKTYNLFQERENFFSRFNIHILQCDMKIQEAVIVHTPQEFTDYIEHMEITGLGGTDFRPVFNYIDEQLEKKVFRDFGGLLYFTDGDGIYPKKKPSYSAAFLFPEGNKDITVPPWAIKYVLEGDMRYGHQSGQDTD